jgi:peptidoglycan/LPS O-acetylase OafA/YrhL
MANAPGSGQIATVQILRALAALTVVFGHTQYDAMITAGRVGFTLERNHALPWGAGVDLFFIISGFIMVYASARFFGQAKAGQAFLMRRLVRIVPLYWVFASAYLFLSSQFGGAASRGQFDLGEIIASYLFWPLDIFDDGHPRPFYTLGWTLNYEMFFYCIFALFLPLDRARAVVAVSLALLVFVIIGLMFPQIPMPLRFWSKPIILEFVLGMLIAEAYLRGLRLPKGVGAALVLAGIVVLFIDPMQAHLRPENWITPNTMMRFLSWGVPMAAIMAGLLLTDWRLAVPDGPMLRFWVSMGDASYALYLVHPFVIVAWRKIWLALGLDAMLGYWPLIASSVLLSIVASFATYRSFEKPMTAWLGRQLVPQPSLPKAGKASSR